MVWGVTDYVGALREVVSLILGFFTKRFGMLLSPSFLGRVFEKERFLKVFLSLCGQQLYVGFSLWMAL